MTRHPLWPSYNDDWMRVTEVIDQIKVDDLDSESDVIGISLVTKKEF